MKKIFLFLSLIAFTATSQVTPVGGYLPLNSSKSFTAGGARVTTLTVAGNETVTGTFSVGSTATVSGNALFSSSVGVGGLPTSSLTSFRVTKGTGTVDIGEASSGVSAIWLGRSAPSSTNYIIQSDGVDNIVNAFNGPTFADLRTGGNTRLRVTSGLTSVTGSLSVSANSFSMAGVDLKAGNTGTVAVLSDAPFIVYLNGGNSAGIISDATTYYISGSGFILSANTSATDGQVLIPWNCTLIGYSFNNRINGTTATSETSTLSLRVDNTTDIALSSTITFSANQSNFTSSALSSTIASGSLISAKIVTPTWVTNPSNIFTGLYLYFTRRL